MAIDSNEKHINSFLHNGCNYNGPKEGKSVMNNIPGTDTIMVSGIFFILRLTTVVAILSTIHFQSFDSW